MQSRADVYSEDQSYLDSYLKDHQKHTKMNLRRNFFSPYLYLGAMLAFFDTQSFNARETFFLGFGFVDPDVFVTYFGYFVFIIILLLSVYESFKGINPRCSRIYVLTGVTLVLVGALRLWIDGYGTLSVFGFETRNLSVLVFIPLVMRERYDRRNVTPFFCGLVIGGLIKAFLIWMLFLAKGGVSVLGVNSIFWDAHSLSILGLIAVILYYKGFDSWRKRDYLTLVVFLILATVVLSVVVGSYRRLPLVRMVGVAILSMLVYRIFERKIWSGLISIGLFCFGLLAVTVIGYLSFFGWHGMLDRLETFSLDVAHQSISRQSNTGYLEDLQSLPIILNNSSYMGVGFRNEYGVYFRSLSLLNIEADTWLHVGMYELIARQGVISVLWFFSVFYLAISALRRVRTLRIEPFLVMCYGAAWGWVVIFFFFPFGGVSYPDIRTVIVTGFSLSWLFQFWDGKLVHPSHLWKQKAV